MLAVGHPNGTLAKITTIESLRLTSGIVLFNVLVILEYSVSLLSVNKMIKDSKFFVGFDEHKCYIQDLNLGKIMGTGSESGGLYLLGHPADQVLSISGTKLGFSKNNQRFPCDICHKAKQTRKPFPLSDHKSKLVGDMVHCDVWGPYRVISKDGFRFFLTIVHDFSRAVWVYLLKSKAEVREYVESFIKLIFTQFGKKIKIENGITERKHRHLLNVARSLMLPSSVLSGVSPYFLVYGKDPGLSHVRSFGCLRYSTILNNNDQFGARGGHSNEDGNIRVISDDYDNIVEDEVADVATQIEENVTSEGNGQINQNGEGPSNVLETLHVLRRSTRQKVMPIKFNDYVVRSHVKYGLEKYVSYANLSRMNFCFSTTLNKSIEPKTFNEDS
ncbi:ribonuclease H-like domain-containing protein [Tanacetum coccineum]|uniref:Ribonuclease H-like domain-containing protein n=1 Tax=Tanacetum coccineum TaxID=301880 RepID=A0ABQ5GI27_9ASTR